MKKIISFILLLGAVMSLSACSSETLTMQDVYDAHQTENILASHEDVSIKAMESGEVYMDAYLNTDFVYVDFGTWATYITDNRCYSYIDGAYNRIVYIEEGGQADLASFRASQYASLVLSPDTLKEDIKSVTEKDDRIIVTSRIKKADLKRNNDGMTSCEFEYVLDAKTLSPIASEFHYAYDDGTVIDENIEFTYDAPIPEGLKTFREFEQQTDDLRVVTIVFEPGTEKENTVTVQVPKGMTVGITSLYGTLDEFEMYADAACTEPYAAQDRTSDATVYIKWVA